MVWHFNCFTWWILFQKLVNVRIYIKWFFPLMNEGYVKDHQDCFSLEQLCLCLQTPAFLACLQNKISLPGVLMAFLNCLHPTQHLRMKCSFMKKTAEQFNGKRQLYFFLCFLSFCREFFTPLPSASVLMTKRRRRSFLFNILKTSYASYGTH